MTVSQAKIIVYNEFMTAWEAGDEKLVDYFFDNMAYDTSGINDFVQLKMLHVPGEQSTLGEAGNRVFRREGIVRAVISTALDKGSQRGDELAQEVLRILEGKSFSSDGNTVRLTDGYPRELSPDGSHYKAEAVVNFYYHDVK